MPVYWPTRAGGTVERDSESVQETFKLYNGASSSSMFALKGRCDLTTGAGGWQEARGGRTGGEGAQGGEESTVDGDFKGARLGKEGQMPYGAVNLGWWIRLIFS